MSTANAKAKFSVFFDDLPKPATQSRESRTTPTLKAKRSKKAVNDNKENFNPNTGRFNKALTTLKELATPTKKVPVKLVESPLADVTEAYTRRVLADKTRRQARSRTQSQNQVTKLR